jgi:hypothetical protein
MAQERLGRDRVSAKSAELIAINERMDFRYLQPPSARNFKTTNLSARSASKKRTP